MTTDKSNTSDNGSTENDPDSLADNGENDETIWSITRRDTMLTGIGLGALGFLKSASRRATAVAGNRDNSSGGPDRSSLQVPVERKIEQADEDEPFRLQIHAEPDRLDDAVDVVTVAGGEVRNSFHDLVIADVPAGRIHQVANSDSIRLVSEHVRAATHEIKPLVWQDNLPEGAHPPDLGAINSDTLTTSEGVEITGADELHDEGITGDGVTIAIFDTRFNIHNERYADQVIATLGADPGDPGFEDAYENPGGHGDAVADIVAAMAPDAELVLGDVFFTIPGFGLSNALNTVETDHSDVDVTNYSVGHLPDFRIDGLDPISLRIADYTENTDSIFVNSAGNSAAIQEAWMWFRGRDVPLPQEYGDVYDSRSDGVFVKEDDKELLAFDEHFDQDLEVSTRLPLITFNDIAVFAAIGLPIGWTIVHWDADPDVDVQDYLARLYGAPDAGDPLKDPLTGTPVESFTANPWETIDVWPQWYQGEVDITMDVEQDGRDEVWVVTDVETDQDVDVAEIGDPNPDLNLPVGHRYTITNDAWEDHPLEFVDVDANPLLSQDPDTEGEFEDDDIVNWEQDNDEIAFTLTDGEALLTGENGLLSLIWDYVSAEDADVAGAVSPQIPPPIFVEVERVDADEDHHFDVWGQFGGVNLPTPWATDARSVGIPALSQDPDLLAAAAVQAVDLGQGKNRTELAFERNADDLKGYSSQGPTQDGRTGIDIAAPSHVSTNARGPVMDVFGFNGTSAAAPHVTGAVGLLSQVEEDNATIREALFETGTGIDDPDVAAPSEDNTQIGSGYLDVAGARDEL